MPPYFNANALPTPSAEYVAWVDVMGVQVSMSRSLATSANFICKLHIMALRSPMAQVTIYPVMDGFYASSPDQRAILDFLRQVLGGLSEQFIAETTMHHRFLVRGGLAYGPVIHGSDIPSSASRELAGDRNYSSSLLLGLPVVQSHASERLAPPFGIYVHESARSFSPADSEPLHYIWWKWRDPNSESWIDLGNALQCYFDWSMERAGEIEYKIKRIEVHRNRARHYFLVG